MYRMLFEPDIMAKYYNCSGRTFEQWKELGSPSMRVGVTYIALGIVFFVTYFPFMVVFIKSDLLKHSCYKIMFFLGIVDMIQIPIGGFLCGYFAIIGNTYCMFPTFNYVIGGFAFGLWIAGSSTCMLLAFNRCLDILNHTLAVSLFGGRRTYFWLVLPFTYAMGCWLLHPSTVFTSVLDAFFFDPFIGMPERHGGVDTEHYPFALLSMHNVVVVLWLLLAYGGLCAKLTLQARGLTALQMSRVQRQAFATAFLICIGTFVCAVNYCIMQFLPTPPWLPFVGELGWLFSHGMVGFTYFLMNATMRKEFYRIFLNQSNGATVSATGNTANQCSVTATADVY